MKKKVLEEAEYLRIIEGIIRRDYYPQLPSLLTETEMDWTLEDFQAKFTTEDDSSFSALLQRINRQRRKRYQALYPMLPNATQGLLCIEGSAQSRQSRQINSENTGLLAEQVDEPPRKVVKPKSFVPMTPSSSRLIGSLRSSQISNLLKSARRQSIKSSPFGGQTPQRKTTKPN